MEEFIARLRRQPRLAAQLLTASLLVNLLALASPLFVTQVLNRYVAHGVDATLVTLTSGTVIAVIAEFLFRQLRHRMAKRVNDAADEEIGLAGFAVLAHGKVPALEQIPAGKRREIVNGAAEVEAAYGASNLNTLLDLPFSVIFILVLGMLSPYLAVVAVAFIGGTFYYALRNVAAVKESTNELRNASGVSGGVLETALREVDTVHAFNAAAFVKRKWFEASNKAGHLRALVGEKQNLMQTVTQTSTALMGVAIITIGALLVVTGNLDVGAMIGANILASRAMQPTSKFAQIGGALTKARQALQQLEDFIRLPLEADAGSARSHYTGGIELRDLAFFYPGANMPLFESLDARIEPGSVVLVVGGSGTGKTTLARLLVGLLEPVRGQILVDGMNLRQVSPEWWRRQLVYLPQEPTFLNASIADNLRIANPEADMGRLNAVIDAAGLRRFMDESANGFDTMINDNGRQLAVGVRRSLALARALMSDGRVAIIDEMFDGFDSEGRAAMNAALNSLVKGGRTVIVAAHSAKSMAGISAVIDLNEKPRPRVIAMAPTAPPATRPPEPGVLGSGEP